MPANPLSQNGNLTLSMIKKNSQALPHTKPKPSLTPSTQPDISTSSSFSLETSTTPSSRTTLQDVPAVDLLALKEELKAEIKKSLFEEFNTMLHQELASFQATIRSSLSNQTSIETQTMSISDLNAMLKAVLKEEITSLWTKFQDALKEIEESLLLLHKQIQCC